MRLAVVALLLCACSQAEEVAVVDSSFAPIQGGFATDAEPAVGLLLYEDGGYCTATLIAPNVILTAAHCVQKPLRAFRTNGKDHAIRDKRSAPFYLDLWCPNPTNDVAVVRLAQSITDIAPIPFGKAPPNTGSSCTAIGFGIHNTASGTVERMRKRQGTSRIKEISNGSIKVEYETAVADSGDSGGPLLCDGTIVGTVGCHNDDEWPKHRYEYYERTDKVLSWIREALDDWE